MATDLEDARAALARQDWAGAYEGFAAADRSSLTGADLEGYADAAWWGSHLRESLEIRTEAYAAYDAEGNDARAGWTAARLAIEHAMRGDVTVGGGFLLRAQRHVAALPEGREHGFLAVLEATIASFGGDAERALARSADAVRIAQAVGDPELRALALHTQGMTMVALGRVADGVALLDEAMAGVVAGEVGPHFTGIIYCNADLHVPGPERPASRRGLERGGARVVRDDPAGLAVPGDVPGEPGRGRRGCVARGPRPRRRRSARARS